MNELANMPAEGAIASEIDAALLEKNKAIDAADGENVESPATKEPAKEDPVQKRIDKLTKEKYDARRKADLAEYRTKELESRLAALEAKPAQPATVEPTLESVGFDEAKYREAVRDWLKKEIGSTVRDEVKKTVPEVRSQLESQKAQTEFEKRQADFAKANPDYVEKVLENDDLPITNDMAKVMRESERGPEIALYLANHVEIAENISRLSALSQAREIGRIEATLEKKPPKVSSAPPPVPKIDAGQPARELDLADSSGWSNKQFKSWRKKFM